MKKCFKECDNKYDIIHIDFNIKYNKEYCKCILQCYKKNDENLKKEKIKKRKN
jgi:hypothetical protein